MFSPAPAVLGVGVCSKTSIVVKTPDSRRARAVISPAMPPPAMSARIISLRFPLDGSRLPAGERGLAAAIGASNYPIDKFYGRPPGTRDARRESRDHATELF